MLENNIVSSASILPLFDRLPYIAGAIAVLGILIFVHELGHFLVAKFFGVGVLEFALGFGRRLTTIQRGETSYTWRLIPLGGFVRMAGDDPRLISGELEPGSEAGGASPIEGTQEELTEPQRLMVADQTRWFLKKPYLQRCAIVLAGPLANFLFAWFLASAMYYVKGIPEPQVKPAVVGSLVPGNPAEAGGLKPGDRLVTVDGAPINSYGELVEVVRGSGGKALTVVVERPITDREVEEPNVYEPRTFTIQPKAEFGEIDIAEGRASGEPVYRIGLTPPLTYVPCSLYEALQAGGLQVANIVSQSVRMMVALVQGKISPKRAVGGPIEIVNQTAHSAKQGWGHLIVVMILINVALGVMNLLPIPVLDGGHLAIFTIEKIKGSPISMKAQMIATQVGMAVLMMLMVFAFSNDLRRIFFPG